MGKLEKGIFGPISGTVGDMIYYVRNGKNLVRRKGGLRKKKPATVPQLAVRMGMKVVVDFLRPILEFTNRGFGLKAKGTDKSAYNLAVKYNKINALKGSYPDIQIDYAKALVADGSIDDTCDMAVALVDEGLCFTWSCQDTEWPRFTDQVMLLAYFPSLKRAVYLLAGARRKDEMQVLTIPADWIGLPAELYVSFASEDRERMFKSTYLGRVWE